MPRPDQCVVVRPMSKKAEMMADVYKDYDVDSRLDSLRLSSSTVRIVHGEGNLNASVVFVGEAPGEQENKHGRPFRGKAGQILDQLLESAEIKRERVFITNIVKYRPAKNRTPNYKELEVSRQYLARELAIIRPEVTVLLGAAATRAVWMPNRPPSVTKEHGSIVDRGRPWVYALMFHPMALGYAGDLTPGIDDMRNLRNWCDMHGISV